MFTGTVTGAEALKQDDSRIIAELADLVRQADIVVAHNGDRFDLPVLNSRLFGLGLEPIGNVKTIDTLKLAKHSFRQTHNTLDSLAKFLGLPGKLKTGFELWRQCCQGDEKALARMSKYNVQDVRLLEQVFDRMKPYVKLPKMVRAEREMERVCPFCGSDDLYIRGYYDTNASTFGKLQCQTCRKYSRFRSPERLKKVGLVPL